MLSGPGAGSFLYWVSSVKCLNHLLWAGFILGRGHTEPGASLVSWMVKSSPAIQETHIRFLGWEDPLEKELATHSSILAWGIPWTEEPGGL